MKPTPHCFVMLACSALLAAAHAQVPATSPSTPKREEAVQLSVFEVSTQRDYGYRAATALSATGTGMDIKDTPVTVNVLTREFIDDLGTANLKDALQYVPGVNTSARNANTVVVRGFFPGERSEFGATGLPIGGGEFTERIEVMKGPNAIFFGRVAPGGVLNRIGKQPRFSAGYTVDLQYGSYDFKKFALDATGPLTRQLAYRFVGYALDKGDGFEDFTGERGKGAKLDLLFRPFPRTNLRLQVSAEDQKVRRIHSPARTVSGYLQICAPGGRYDPTIVFNGIPCTQSPHVWAMNQNARLRAAGQLNAYFVDRYFHDVHPRGKRAHYDGPDAFNSNTRDGVYAGLDHRFNDVFALKLDYSRNTVESEGLASSWFPRPDGLVVQQPLWNGNLPAPSWNAEAEFVAEFKLGPTSHRLLVGADRSEAETRFWNQTLPAVTFNFSDGSVYRIGSKVSLVRTANTILSWSKADGTYGVGVSRFFSDRLIFLYGARRTRVTQGVNGTARSNGEVVTPYRKTGGRVLTDDTFQGGLVYKLAPAISAFAGYGETYEPQTTISFDGSRLDPVSGKGWELGTKAEFLEGRLATTLSVFRNERIGIANRDFGREITTGTLPWFIAGGSEASEGAELEIFYAPIRNYQAMLGYANLWTAETIANKENANLVGRGLQFTPKDTVSFWNRYTFTTGALKHLTIGGGLRYNGKHEALANLDWFKIINPGWTRLDLLLAYETKLLGRRTHLQLNVENLLNKYYYDGEYTAGRPRMITLRTRFTF